MTTKIGSDATSKVIERITRPAAVNAGAGRSWRLAGDSRRRRCASQNVAADLAERSDGAKYPAVNVYCEKIVNKLKEKFRTFSGTAQMVVELRHSQDRLEGLQDAASSFTRTP